MGKIFGYIKLAFFAIIALAVLNALFSDSSDDIRVVDLDVVLDTMVATLDGLDGGDTSDPATAPAEVQEDPSKTSSFLATYHSNLNAAKMVPGPVGVVMEADGSILGFDDTDTNNEQAGGEADLFRVEIDAENSRLVATDLEGGYHRDRGFSMGGLMTGYLLGRMLTSQRASGVRTSKFSSMRMQKPGYASAVRASKRASAKASRGSRSFSRGK